METIRIDDHEQQIAKLCHALGHPLRVGIVKYIAGHPGCICNDIVLRTDRAQSTISEHLRVLINAGLIECQHDGQASAYYIHSEALQVLSRGLEAIRAQQASPKSPNEQSKHHFK
ncbi:MAG: winged helix-turn-helix transcriptional regulator [Herpetosiphonaceae bacterium]|nr:winged helix-turn-helix transcriptional regulator [Herpetosiphonaceae bacterium]